MEPNRRESPVDDAAKPKKIDPTIQSQALTTSEHRRNEEYLLGRHVALVSLIQMLAGCWGPPEGGGARTTSGGKPQGVGI